MNRTGQTTTQVFTNNTFGNLTVFIQGGQPWFVAKEVATALGYSQTNAMTRRLRDKDKDNIPEFLIYNEVKKLAQTIPSVAVPMVFQDTDFDNILDQNDKLAQTNSQVRGAFEEGVRLEDSLSKDSIRGITVITESGLYDAVFGSQKEEAQAFKYWVCDEVLSSIRKNGMYATDKTIEEMLDDPDLMIKTLLKLKEEKAGRLIAEEAARAARVEATEKQRMLEHKEIKIQADAPKVEQYEKMINADDTYSISSIASTLGTTAIALNRHLRSHGIQYYKSSRWHLYTEHANKNYTKDVTTEHNGQFKSYMRWTALGREAIIKHWNLYN